MSAKRPKQWGLLLTCFASLAESGVAMTLPDGQTVSSDDADVDDRLSEACGRPLTLVSSRDKDDVYISEWPDLGDNIFSNQTMDLPVAQAGQAAVDSFVDVRAIHLLTTSSLAWAKGISPSSVITSQRFRPNFVIDNGTVAAVPENEWRGREMMIGEDGLRLFLQRPTPRCVMTTLAQPDLPQDRDLLQAIVRNNRVRYEDLDGYFGCLGMNADVLNPGTIRRGDAVSLT